MKDIKEKGKNDIKAFTKITNELSALLEIKFLSLITSD